MSDQILNQILNELKSLNLRMDHFESGQSELHQITSAVRDRQEETDAKLEALTTDINKLHGSTVRIEDKIDENLNDIRGDVRFLSHHIVALEKAPTREPFEHSCLINHLFHIAYCGLSSQSTGVRSIGDTYTYSRVLSFKCVTSSQFAASE